MDLDCAEVESYLYDRIPISKAMAVSVSSIDRSSVTLSAPLAPNINHRSTVFGGSISAVAILSAWALLYVQLQILGIPCRIVIQSNRIEYLKPAEGELRAYCTTPPQENWERFIATISKRGKGRTKLSVDVYSRGLLVAKFQGS